ncbi:MAG: hypothetical protein JXB45_10550 [Candidatus Krumholzibacteriota bacterium]|nr:hypothetical protein [Candidatus Krumholzibacteriota bacterium]
MTKIIRSIVILLILLPSACTGQSSRKNPPPVGGCRLDTISLGLEMKRDSVPRRESDRMDILSLRPLSSAQYRQAAEELTALLDSLGVQIYSRSDLIHTREGPCWPAYRITFRIRFAGTEQGESVRAALLEKGLLGLFPAGERPPDYGDFFLSAGRGSSDWWILWYAGVK